MVGNRLSKWLLSLWYYEKSQSRICCDINILDGEVWLYFRNHYHSLESVGGLTNGDRFDFSRLFSQNRLEKTAAHSTKPLLCVAELCLPWVLFQILRAVWG